MDHPQPGRKRLPRKVREQQMLDAAVQVFSRHGFHAASMDEVAEQAQVSKPLLYQYLGSKEEIFSACIAREADRLVNVIGAATRADDGDPADLLWRGLTAFFAYVADHRASWVVLYQQARTQSDTLASQVARTRAEIVDTVTGLVRRSMESTGRGPGGGDYAALRREAAAVAHALVGAADALAEWALGVPGEQPQDTARRVMDLVWVGLERRAKGEGFSPPEAPLPAPPPVPPRPRPAGPVSGGSGTAPPAGTSAGSARSSSRP
ncbi:TetR/AcrR family transcriptional regulator [Kitasatospora sp. NPDC057223]|uniref:TetR/AcrR family transcriptional regulator n=1 Tax=Kitasatospora sp. NPDC057223 TaxID=3346055 RepID=UPI0036401119